MKRSCRWHLLVEVFPNTVKNTSSSVKQVSEGVTRSVKILRKAVLIPDKHRPKPDSKFPSTKLLFKLWTISVSPGWYHEKYGNEYFKKW